MNIYQAALKAAEIGGLIVRPQWRGLVHIKPTNGPDCCIPYGKGRQPGKRWNPCAEDLVAEDWEVTTEEFSGGKIIMGKTKEMLIEKYEPKVSELAQITGYDFDFLWGIWMECLEERAEISEEANWSYFRGVTLEFDW